MMSSKKPLDDLPERDDAAEPEPPAAVDDDAALAQFTLRELFVIVTVFALISLPLSRLPRTAFAGLLGGVTVLWMLLQAFFEPQRALVRYGWWALLCLYLLACGLAILDL